MTQKLHIYAPDTVCQIHLRDAGVPDVVIYDDLDRFCEFDIRQRKIAFLHSPYPIPRDVQTEFEDKIRSVLPYCDKIIIAISELHKDSLEIVQHIHHPKISYFTCGFIEGLETDLWMDWFDRTAKFYKFNNLLDQLSPYTVKSKTFDILLGIPRPHRTAIYNFINDNHLNDLVVMTYRNNDLQSLPGSDTPEWIWESAGLELPDPNIKWTISNVRYHGCDMSLSQVVPLSIYNQTAYSVVAETCMDNGYSFFTEKTVKPIMAERLFVASSGRHFLKNLRKLGFKTFDGIIDESYDEVYQLHERTEMIAEQLMYLFTQPQEEILAKIRPITEHNKQVMMETDWYGDYIKNLTSNLQNFPKKTNQYVR